MAAAMIKTDAGFKFRAFSSYTDHDRSTHGSVACTKALENYRIPKDLQGTPGRDGPNSETAVCPIFRDRDELSSVSRPVALDQRGAAGVGLFDRRLHPGVGQKSLGATRK